MNWKPGDRALIIAADKGEIDIRQAGGKTCTLIRYMGDFTSDEIPGIRLYVENAWRVRVDDGDVIGVDEKALAPIDYDGDEKTTWDECPWQPTKEEITK